MSVRCNAYLPGWQLLEDIKMSKKLDKLRNVVGKLAARYGEHDDDVRRLQVELDALEACVVPPQFERRAPTPDKFNFQSLAKQHYNASRHKALP
jgi:hypothetical protein